MGAVEHLYNIENNSNAWSDRTKRTLSEMYLYYLRNVGFPTRIASGKNGGVFPLPTLRWPQAFGFVLC